MRQRRSCRRGQEHDAPPVRIQLGAMGRASIRCTFLPRRAQRSWTLHRSPALRCSEYRREKKWALKAGAWRGPVAGM